MDRDDLMLLSDDENFFWLTVGPHKWADFIRLTLGATSQTYIYARNLSMAEAAALHRWLGEMLKEAK